MRPELGATTPCATAGGASDRRVAFPVIFGRPGPVDGVVQRAGDRIRHSRFQVGYRAERVVLVVEFAPDAPVECLFPTTGRA